MSSIICGILAFQGNFKEHKQIFLNLGVSVVEIRYKKQIPDISHLIIPGGESTVMSKFLQETEMDHAIQQRVKMGNLKVFGICAGAILLAKNVISDKKVKSLGLIDLTIQRNAYGSQIDSFEDFIYFKSYQKYITGIFIRAPKIIKYNKKDCEILASYQSSPALIRNKNILLSTLHPEYLSPPIVHQYFLNM